MRAVHQAIAPRRPKEVGPFYNLQKRIAGADSLTNYLADVLAHAVVLGAAGRFTRRIDWRDGQYRRVRVRLP